MLNARIHWRVDGPQQERACDLSFGQHMAANPLLQRLDIDRDVGEFRHKARVYENTSMTAAEALTHLRYSGWASRKLLDAARSLNPEDLTRKVGVSHESILGTLSHIHFADRIWYSRVVDPKEPLIKEADLPTLEREWWDIQRKWETWAEGLSDSGLERVVAYKSLDGKGAFENVTRDILLHLVNHATLHRGQAVGMIRQLGIAPPVTDLIFYHRETAR
jgi:uncharacterized damage-inducible protein DinB